MVEQGIHPKIMSERLGHSDVSITLNTYSHVLRAVQDQAAEKLDRLLTTVRVSDEIKKLGDQASASIASPSQS